MPSYRFPLGLRRLLPGLLLAVSLLATTGCVRNFANPFERGTGASADAVELYVENQNFNDVRLWKLGPEGRQSVGYVTGSSTRTFQVSWRQPGALRFEIEPLAGRSYQTNAISASPGDELRLFIRENPNSTYLTRR